MRGSTNRRPLRRRILGTALVVCACALAACASSGADKATQSPSSSAGAPAASTASTASTSPVAAEYLPGLAAEVRAPVTAGPAPLVVMVPGGGWASADPTGLVPLAEALTRDGSTTSLITYSTSDSGSRFPAAADEVACAVRWSAQQAAASGHPPTHVVVLGHSAGGHLAALAALSGREFGADCPDPPVEIDGLIGMAGIYDTDQARPMMSTWVGADPSSASDAWDRVNPVAWLRANEDRNGELRVLLLHGDGDTAVPLTQTTAFAAALEAAGLDTTTTILPGLDHLQLFEAHNAEPPIRAWLDAWR